MDTEYADAVLDLVGEIPPGRVTTYGIIADVVADRLVAAGSRRRGGPRQSAAVLARFGSEVPWWRVVTASGRVPQRHRDRALAALRAEGTAMAGPLGDRVDLVRAIWWPS